MDNKILKTSLFGYSKASVCEYIAQVNQQFSEKLMTATAENKAERAALNEKITSLEKELDEYKRAHGEISSAILEAQQYAAELKRQAEKEAAQMRTENAREKSVLDNRIEKYVSEIDKLRKQMDAFAKVTGETLDTYEQKLKVVTEGYGVDGGTEINETSEEANHTIA